MKLKELNKRILVAVFGIPILLTGALIGKWIFLLIIDIIVVTACWEFYRLAEKKNYKPQKVLGVIAVFIISLDMYLNSGHHIGWIFSIVIFISMINELFKKNDNHFLNAAITVIGVGYISFLSFFLLIRNMDAIFFDSYTQNGWLVIYIFILIWACDSGAYFVGHHFGHYKLYNRISPNKTWEGAIAGFLISISVAVGFKWIIVKFLSLMDCLVLGMIVGIVGQLSDLVESMYKRNVGVKDTSNILPGHGGMLDRFDSLMFIGPIVYLYLIIKSSLL